MASLFLPLLAWGAIALAQTPPTSASELQGSGLTQTEIDIRAAVVALGSEREAWFRAYDEAATEEQLLWLQVGARMALSGPEVQSRVDAWIGQQTAIEIPALDALRVLPFSQASAERMFQNTPRNGPKSEQLWIALLENPHAGALEFVATYLREERETGIEARIQQLLPRLMREPASWPLWVSRGGELSAALLLRLAKAGLPGGPVPGLEQELDPLGAALLAIGAASDAGHATAEQATAISKAYFGRVEEDPTLYLLRDAVVRCVSVLPVAEWPQRFDPASTELRRAAVALVYMPLRVAYAPLMEIAVDPQQDERIRGMVIRRLLRGRGERAFPELLPLLQPQENAYFLQRLMAEMEAFADERAKPALWRIVEKCDPHTVFFALSLLARLADGEEESLRILESSEGYGGAQRMHLLNGLSESVGSLGPLVERLWQQFLEGGPGLRLATAALPKLIPGDELAERLIGLMRERPDLSLRAAQVGMAMSDLPSARVLRAWFESGQWRGHPMATAAAARLGLEPEMTSVVEAWLEDSSFPMDTLTYLAGGQAEYSFEARQWLYENFRQMDFRRQRQVINLGVRAADVCEADYAAWANFAKDATLYPPVRKQAAGALAQCLPESSVQLDAVWKAWLQPGVAPDLQETIVLGVSAHGDARWRERAQADGIVYGQLDALLRSVSLNAEAAAGLDLVDFVVERLRAQPGQHVEPPYDGERSQNVVHAQASMLTASQSLAAAGSEELDRELARRIQDAPGGYWHPDGLWILAQEWHASLPYSSVAACERLLQVEPIGSRRRWRAELLMRRARWERGDRDPALTRFETGRGVIPNPIDLADGTGDMLTERWFLPAWELHAWRMAQPGAWVDAEGDALRLQRLAFCSDGERLYFAVRELLIDRPDDFALAQRLQKESIEFLPEGWSPRQALGWMLLDRDLAGARSAFEHARRRAPQDGNEKLWSRLSLACVEFLETGSEQELQSLLTAHPELAERLAQKLPESARPKFARWLEN